MVRINLINPKKLADQHLIAEYNEILMLFGHVDKFPQIRNQPKEFTLGKGHINFFKDKLAYLRDRHEILKEEMKKRNMQTNKTISLHPYPRKLKNNWKPSQSDKKLIAQRISKKINLKPNYYRYYGERRHAAFFLNLLSSTD